LSQQNSFHGCRETNRRRSALPNNKNFIKQMKKKKRKKKEKEKKKEKKKRKKEKR
jgi:hypothetical protein